MRFRNFITKLDEASITDAIHSAELDTTGKIRVFISSRPLGQDNIMDRAIARFQKLGLTEEHGILLYFVPLDRRFAILAGDDVYEHYSHHCWKQLALKIEDFLHRQLFNEAILNAIEESGKMLARHFPRGVISPRLVIEKR